MSAFAVELKNVPGGLAQVCEAMAARDVNIVLCATTRADRGVIGLIADDEAAARTALEDSGLEFTERPALTIQMENVPGTGAVTFRKLAEANVNIELLLPVRVSDEQFFAVICVDDIETARQALGEQVIDG